MFSGEGEEVEFRGKKLYPTGNVEDWMLEIENCMKESLRLIIKDALDDYVKVRHVLIYWYVLYLLWHTGHNLIIL